MNARRGQNKYFALIAVVAALLAGAIPSQAALESAAHEQALVYEINRARWDPGAFGVRSGRTVPSGLLPAPPLSFDPSLGSSSHHKASEIAGNDYFGHQSPVTGMWPNQLAREHGYSLPDWWRDDANYIESLYGGVDDPARVLGAFLSSPTHRRHIFGEGGFSGYDEVGVGMAAGRGANWWAVHTAYDERDSAPHVIGFVFADADGDGSLDVGEGLPGITITYEGQETVTDAGGAFALDDRRGRKRIFAKGPGLDGRRSTTILVKEFNVWVDFVAGASDPVVRAYDLCRGHQPTILGTDGDDVLRGTPGPDVIHGLDGDDVIIGRGGDDIVCGGRGDDRIRAGAGRDLVFGGRGNDTLIGARDADILRGGPGDDSLRGGGGRDALNGGAGADFLHAGPGWDHCKAGESLVRCRD